MEEYKKDTADKLLESKKRSAEDAFENALLEKMIATIEGDIPEAMYESQAESIMQDYAYRMQAQGITLENYLKITGMDMAAFRDSMKPQAERQVKTTLALEYVAKVEGLTVSAEEIDAEFAKMAEQYGMEVERIKELLPTESMEHDLLMQKTVKLIAEAGVKVAPKAEEAPAADAE